MRVPGSGFRVPSASAQRAARRGTAAAAALAAALVAVSCSWNVKGENFKVDFSESGASPWRRGILATCFWVGEPGNEQSAWDPRWAANFGGVDDPRARVGFRPAGFVPALSTFYCALPYNDVAGRPDAKSALKGRWVEVRAGGRSCYCQWEDVGPWYTDDRAYVLGRARPRAEAEGKAGIDLSPAVRDYLRLTGKDLVDWRLVEAEGVPAGPWKRVITGSGADTSAMGG